MCTPTWPLARSRIVRALEDTGHGDPSVEECAAALERARRVAELPSSDLRELRLAVAQIVAEVPDSTFEDTWPDFVQRHARRESARALGRVALAAAEFQEREGRRPESLDALAPMFPEGVPTDPCDGKPFEFVVADGKVRLSARGFFPEAPPADPEEQAEPKRREYALVWEFRER